MTPIADHPISVILALLPSPPTTICRWANACLATSLFILSGCASHAWSPPPGKSVGDFEAQKAQCSIFARNGGQGFAAAGTRNFVVGAAVGNAVGNSVKAQQDFNDCMAGNGWTIADQTPERVAANQERSDKLKNIVSTRISCTSLARAEARFSAIIRHLPDVSTSKFSISQLADATYPTEDEANLFALYSDRSTSCRDTSILATAPITPPAFSQYLRDAASVSDGNAVLLVRRQITWGEWSSRQTQTIDDVNAKLRTVRF